MPKPQSSVTKKTVTEDLDLIRAMAKRHGDAEIARVLNKLGRTTAKGNRWRADRVKTTRHRHGIAAPARRAEDDEIIGIVPAAKYRGVSATTIRRLAARGILHYQQVAPYAPWVISKRDLDTDPVRSICEHLKRTGKLDLDVGCCRGQTSLFREIPDELQ